MTNCIRIHPADNTAVILDDAKAGEIVAIIGKQGNSTVTLLEPIKVGHKVALRTIPIGDKVKKYGIVIGCSTQQIQPGEWVHLHNCASDYDKRSALLDVHTGSTTDTIYE
ncbi:MAG: UxaA family hydrolase [Chloroflexi bacterium]|nr:UxaA family hydrolase [Chloroflexota bacterium]